MKYIYADVVPKTQLMRIILSAKIREIPLQKFLEMKSRFKTTDYEESNLK